MIESLKKDFYKLAIVNGEEQVLLLFYCALLALQSFKPSLWKTLSLAEQAELFLADLESEDENNCITHENMKKKWLLK